MTIWVCESGKYEQRSIDFICSSLESGVAHLKSIYRDPYIVRWGELRENKRDGRPSTWAVIGYFEAVQGKSTRHDCEFEFEEYEVK